jgi:hypothetical protein
MDNNEQIAQVYQIIKELIEPAIKNRPPVIKSFTLLILVVVFLVTCRIQPAGSTGFPGIEIQRFL